MAKRISLFLLLASLLTTSQAGGSDIESAYADFGKAYDTLDKESIKPIAEDFLQIAKEYGDVFYLTKAYFYLGFICSRTDDFGNAVIYYLEGSRFAQKSQDPEIQRNLVSMYKNLSNILGDYGHFDLSQRFNRDALAMAWEQKDTAQAINLINNRIHNLTSNGEYQKALTEIDSLLSATKIPLYDLIGFHNKAGNANKELGNLDEALRHFRWIIGQDPSINPTSYAYSLENIGIVNRWQGNYDKAIKYHDAIYHNTKFDNPRRLLGAYEGLGIIHHELKQYNKALEYYHNAIAIMEAGGHYPDTYELYKSLSILHHEMGDTEQALKFSDIYTKNLEEFIAQQKVIEELDKRYNIQLLTERYFDLLAADTKKQELEQNASILIISIITLFLTLIGYMYYRQNVIRSYYP